jgi:phage shock protein A
MIGSLHEIIQAKENLISQQAARIAGLEICQRNLEAEIQVARQHAEELEREAATAVESYKGLHDQLERALGESPHI